MNSTFKLIAHSDGDDLLFCPRPATAETFLKVRLEGLAKRHVDALFYGTGGFLTYTHDTRVADRHPSDPVAVDGGRQLSYAAADDLIASGRDNLSLAVEFAHAHGMQIYWTMRMNDTHDHHPVADGQPRHPCFAPWKREHPHCLMGKPGDRVPWMGGVARWSAVDYGEGAVREQVFRIAEEVIERYDVDGIDLDFFRHPLFFRPQYRGDPVTQAHCDQMTGLVRRIRTAADAAAAKRGRPFGLSARIPDSVPFCREIGLDVMQWLRESLFDSLSGSGYFHLNPWSEFAALGRSHGLPAIACISGSRMRHPQTGKPLPIERLRGEILSAWRAGVSGIFLYNLFDATSELFDTAHDPAALAARPHDFKPHPLGSWWARPEYWLKGGNRYMTLPFPGITDPAE